MDEDDLETNASKPASASVDGTAVSQHSLRDQMEFLDRKAANEAVTSSKRGFVLQRLGPPGSI
jgi:methyl coenzyme M reductase gamma subunit